MTEETDPARDHDSAADVGHDQGTERTTAPMSEYTSRHVGIGIAVFVVGAAVAFGVPLLVGV